MKAVRIHKHGGLDLIRYEDVQEPRCEPDGVIVRMRAAALNHLDIWVRQGIPTMNIPLPLILGSDLAGEIVEVGSKVSHVTVGDAVIAQPGVSCGHCRACLAGQDNVCSDFGILGETRDGTYSEYVSLPAINVAPKPANLTWEEAAAMPLVFLTAWHMLVAKARVRLGQDVLVIAAGSGVGTAAVQIAKLFGARVFAAAGSDEKLQKARELGADFAINYTKSDVAAEVRRLTNRRGVDVVVENVGPATWEGSMKALARNGRLVTCGATSGGEVGVNLRFLFWHHLEILGSSMGSKAELPEIIKHAEAGRLKPVIDEVFPLGEVVAAQQKMIDRGNFGKIVLVPHTSHT